VLTGQILDTLPVWAVYLLTVLFMFAAMEGGYRLGKTRLRESIAKPDSGVGAIVGATLGLLAFLLAFVVSFAATIFNERRIFVVDEANAIGTAYLRSGYLDEPYRTDSRDLLREYVDMRLAAREPEAREMALTRSEKIHDELWSRAEIIARENPVDTIAIYIESINEVIDMHTERVHVGVGIRVPPTILLGLYLVALGTMFLVGMGSAYKENRNHIALILLILILSVVFLLIVDLDRSQDGLLRVPQQALIDLQRQLNR
jgi:hypothetical protein